MASEYGEDIWILENIGLPNTGFYLDLGCAWPTINSNTEFLRFRGWGGVAVDGNPAYEGNWHGVAPFINAVVGDGSEVGFECLPNPDLSRIGNGPIVQTLTLDTITKDIPKIDFISCDLEGNEFDALSRLDWSRHRPGIIIAEYNTMGKGEDFRVREMMEKMGYRTVHQTIANFVYVA